jgi:hypothetical protein
VVDMAGGSDDDVFHAEAIMREGGPSGNLLFTSEGLPS